MLKKPCSPYDQIQPLAQKGSRFQPAQTLGKSWQVELRPGGDVYYQPVGQKDPCWDKPFRPQAHSQIDKVACVDAGNFDIVVLLDRSENVTSFQAWAYLLVKAGQWSSLKTEDALGAFNGTLVRSVSGVASASVDLITLQQLEESSGLKNLDSCGLTLYTKGSDEAAWLSESYWVYGVKGPKEALACIAQAKMKAEQFISLEDALKLKCPMVLKLELPAESSLACRLLDFRADSIKGFNLKCRIGDNMALVVGFSILGYGEGGFGL